MDFENKNLYVISLDALDINLIPSLCKRSYDKVTPLWTKRNLELRNDEFYEFEIKTKEELSDIKKSIEYLTCHICDIEVPKTYYSEHKSSFRHKFNNKIAEIALKRLQRQINVDQYADDEGSDPSTYFCQQCSIIVNRKDEQNHKGSLMHKNSILLERFMNDFLYFYTDSVDNDDETKFKNVKPRTDLNIALTNTNDKVVEINTKSNTNSKQEMTSKEYIALLNRKFNMKPMFLKEKNNYFEVETVDGSIVMVENWNFHSLQKLGCMVHCLVCERIFDFKQVNEHITSNGHMKFMSTPLIDKHCMRQINEDQSHCAICNIVVENSDIHALCNSEHNNRLKIALISDKLTENPNSVDGNDNAKRLYTDIVKSETSNVKKLNTTHDIRYASTSNVENISDYQETNKRFCKTCNISVSTRRAAKHEQTKMHINNSKSDYHYMLKMIENGDMICVVCEEVIKNNLLNITVHFTGTNHTKKYKLLLSTNFMSIVDKNALFCRKCSLRVFKKNELSHIGSKKHKNYIKSSSYNGLTTNDLYNVDDVDINITEDDDDESQDLVTIPINVESEFDSTTEEVCGDDGANDLDEISSNSESNENVDIPIFVESIHLRANDNSENGNKTNDKSVGERSNNDNDNLNKNNNNATNPIVVETKIDKNYYYCVVCQVNVPNNEHNVAMHENGRPHKANLVKFKEERFKALATKPTSEEVKGFTHYQMMLTSPNVMTCILCNVELTCNETNILTHIKGANHSTKYYEMMTENFLAVTENGVFCAACSVNCGLRSELIHCFGKRHIKNLEQMKKAKTSN